jgi:hypothetical protein
MPLPNAVTDFVRAFFLRVFLAQAHLWGRAQRGTEAIRAGGWSDSLQGGGAIRSRGGGVIRSRGWSDSLQGVE